MEAEKKKPKILILIMSAEMEFFKNQLEDVKNTWISNIETWKDIISKYADIVDWKYYDAPFDFKCSIYKDEENKNHVSVRKDGIEIDDNDKHHLKCSLFDDNMTFTKTLLAFQWANENLDYDYIIRTNTSTYINLLLLSYILYREMNENKKWEDTAMGTDLMSLYSLPCPNTNDIYIRGNCLILTKKQVNVILKYGTMFSYGLVDMSNTQIIDDTVIGSILNSYYNKFMYKKKNGKRNLNYLKHIKCIPQMWYKCTDQKNNFNHQMCEDGYGQEWNTNEDASSYAHAVAIQVRSYYTQKGRSETEHEHYTELHQKMVDQIFPVYNYEQYLFSIYSVIESYEENPDVWIQGNLAYITQNELLDIIKDENVYEQFQNHCFQLTPFDHQNRKAKKRMMEKYHLDFLLQDIKSDHN